ncbi:MAG: HDOD domain-containing protein [Bryobacteraceae bacterium]
MVQAATDTDYRERVLETLQHLPPYSRTMAKLRAALANEWVDFRTLVPLVEADVVIANTILRIANSALYGRGSMASISRAMAMLGLARLRNLILGLGLNQICHRIQTPPGWPAKRFHFHSLATAVVCDLLAARVPVSGVDAAFSAGLFHDFGKLLIVTALPEQFVRIRTLQSAAQVSPEECEQQILGFTHGEISAEALRRSGMPGALVAAAQYHHHPADDSTDCEPGKPIRLSELVQASDSFAIGLGYSVFPVESARPEEAVARAGAAALPLRGGIGDVPQLAGEFQELFGSLTTAMGM